MIKHKWNSNHMFSVVWPWVCVAFQRREQTLFAALGNRDRVCWVGVGGLYLHDLPPGVNWGQEGLPSWPVTPEMAAVYKGQHGKWEEGWIGWTQYTGISLPVDTTSWWSTSFPVIPSRLCSQLNSCGITVLLPHVLSPLNLCTTLQAKWNTEKEM